ncbi:hypothetical protein D9M71_699690 [compost metagenome]
MLNDAFVQVFAEDLEALGGQMDKLCMGTSSAHLVVRLLPADDRAGMRVDVVEALALGEHAIPLLE